MQIDLSPELEQFVNDLVSSGRYESASEVVTEALDSLRHAQQFSVENIPQLREKLAAGAAQLDRGESTPFSAEEIMRKGREILAARRAAAQ